MATLEREAGVPPGDFSSDIAFLRSLILSGQWDDVVAFVAPLVGEARGAAGGGGDDAGAAARARVLHEVRRQQFLEMVAGADAGGRGGGGVGGGGGGSAASAPDVAALVRQLKLLEGTCSRDEYNGLCYLLTLSDPRGHAPFIGWTPHSGRLACFNSLLPVVQAALARPPDAPRLRRCPEGQLLTLVRQAAAYSALAAVCEHPGAALVPPACLDFDVLGEGDGGYFATRARDRGGDSGVGGAADAMAAAAAAARRLSLADVIVEGSPLGAEHAPRRGDGGFTRPGTAPGGAVASASRAAAQAAGKPTAPRGTSDTVAGALVWEVNDGAAPVAAAVSQRSTPPSDVSVHSRAVAGASVDQRRREAHADMDLGGEGEGVRRTSGAEMGASAARGALHTGSDGAHSPKSLPANVGGAGGDGHHRPGWAAGAASGPPKHAERTQKKQAVAWEIPPHGVPTMRVQCIASLSAMCDNVVPACGAVHETQLLRLRRWTPEGTVRRGDRRHVEQGGPTPMLFWADSMRQLS